MNRQTHTTVGGRQVQATSLVPISAYDAFLARMVVVGKCPRTGLPVVELQEDTPAVVEGGR